VKHQARRDLVRRLGRLEGPTPKVIHSLRVGADWLADWLDPGEFDELAELLQEGGRPIEDPECQALVRRAWERRARREPRKIFVGVLFDEGREDEAEEELRRRKAWGLDR
jgi:hypothetical protein